MRLLEFPSCVYVDPCSCSAIYNATYLRAQDFNRQSIFGHSMGGHGALTLYLASRTKQYRSASAFSPIANPTQCPWGEKAFKGYLQGGIEEAKKAGYDATELIKQRGKDEPVHILVDYVGRFFGAVFDVGGGAEMKYREPEMTFTRKISCCRKTSSRLRGTQDMMNSRVSCIFWRLSCPVCVLTFDWML